MIKLCHGDYQLDLGPQYGGAVMRFDWRNAPVFRSATGAAPFDTSCFPLVPYSNRIRDGQFTWQGRNVALAPNMAGIAHPLHGIGWLEPWDIVQSTSSSAQLIFHEDGKGEWPWAFEAQQHFSLNDNGLTMRLELWNRSQEVMPAGLGFHPYFPCNAQTRYLGLHQGEWQNSADCLPTALNMAQTAQDWWAGQPVSARNVDTAYTRRDGALEIIWPDQRRRLRMLPSANLPFTLIYTPHNADYFCVEPVSHMTDAVNQGAVETGLIALAPGASVEVHCHLEMFEDA